VEGGAQDVAVEALRQEGGAVRDEAAEARDEAAEARPRGPDEAVEGPRREEVAVSAAAP
jgi:hypothetical protein